ncbi:MAG: ComF family protein [Lachnospiraceae bacterium]|nr:ComF family protein [Lachnospiraceae bacterium]
MAVMGLIRDVYRTVEDIFYPARCPICDGVRPVGERGFCEKCKDKPRIIYEPYCMKCGRETDAGEEYCEECRGKDFNFERGRALCLYDTNMRHSVSNFKYHKRQEYASSYAKLMYEELGDFMARINPSFLVPIPIHRSRYYKRGYNQAELLARELSLLTGIPWDNLLIRVKNTTRQKELDKEERRSNLREAFSINPEKNINSGIDRIMLVDDIYTTGSTLDECAFILKKAGVKEVYFVTLCQGKT